MTKILAAACWAVSMVGFALLARFGLADREAVTTLLVTMPILAFVSMQREQPCGRRG